MFLGPSRKRSPIFTERFITGWPQAIAGFLNWWFRPSADTQWPNLSVARQAAAGLYSNGRVQPASWHPNAMCAWFLRRAGCPQSAGSWPRQAVHYVMFVTSGWGWRACQPHHGDRDNITHNTPAWIHLLPSECLLPIYSPCSAVGLVRPCTAQPFARRDPLLGWWFVGVLCARKRVVALSVTRLVDSTGNRRPVSWKRQALCFHIGLRAD